jgi:hypothetical protein
VIITNPGLNSKKKGGKNKSKSNIQKSKIQVKIQKWKTIFFPKTLLFGFSPTLLYRGVSHTFLGGYWS